MYKMKQQNKKTGVTKTVTTSSDQAALNAEAATMNAESTEYRYWVVKA